ncbi:MAG: glutamine-hydrolyzing GMP synthase [Acidiferrobacterales bacterium]
MTDPHSQRILILDFGSQYTQLIARRVREAGVYCELHSHEMPAASIAAFAPRGVILSGGPESVTESHTPRAPQAVFDLQVPVLGICYGMQALAAQLGGDVDTSARREFGPAQVKVQGNSCLLNGLQDVTGHNGVRLLEVWMSHGDRVEKAPPGFKIIASTTNAPLAAISDEEHQLYGLQFHPEVTHTKQGRAILRRFVREICGCNELWTPGNIVEDLMHSVRTQVGSDEVLLALSGGVDSSVVAALLHRAIGDQLVCIFVDTGLLRLNEADEVTATFSKHMGVKLIRVDAEEQFLSALRGVSDPEAKRKIIGRTFIEVFEQQASCLANVKWLAQGTIYPDVIESAGAKTGKAHVIKSHHNVGGLPERLQLNLLEPLRELFKDEVRRLGEELGLPHKLVYRHPFPGPGLGVRILGEVKKEYADLLRQADAIYLQELEHNGLYDKVSQAFAVFLPVKSVGVVGDQRAYEYVIALRAVETVDFMTANWAQLPYEVLAHISSRIMNEVRGVSRVVYDVSSKPPATIEWE